MNKLRDEGKFVVNGLSDVRKGLKGETLYDPSGEGTRDARQTNQGFDVKHDRSVCPVPWWNDALALSPEDEQREDSIDGEAGDEELLRSIQVRLQRLRLELSRVLNRPTMMDPNLGHVCVCSIVVPFGISALFVP